MERIEICYDGSRFLAFEGDGAELRARIGALMDEGGGWLDVGFGDGVSRPAALYIGPGIPVALITTAADLAAEDPDAP